MTQYQVPAVMAASRVLEHLANDAPDGQTQTELARAVGLSKSSAHNILATLEDLGWVQRDQARLYHLGSRLIGLGAAATRRISIVGLAARRVSGLASEYGLSFAVAQMTPANEAQVVERTYPTTDEHVGIAIGSRYSDHAGALGKAMLALRPPEEAERQIGAATLTAYTPRTITDTGRLCDDIAESRRRGWAASLGELNDNYAVVGFAPSRDPAQQIFLLGLGFPSQLPLDRMTHVGEHLARLAEELNREAGLLPLAASDVNS